MRSAWIVVASASRARLFERVSDRDHIEPIAAIENRDGPRPPPGEALVHGDDDLRVYRQFARRVASLVNDGVQNDRCARLQVFATGPVLGAIREFLDADTMRISAEHATPDLTACSTEELERCIAQLCGSAG